MRVVAITQARMGSMRLPGKVLLDLAGASMLERHVTRLQRTTSLTEVVVATTVQPVDDAVAALCETRGWACFRGSEDDVLDRYYQAARAYNAEVVVRVTADCPLIDPELVDRVVRLLVGGQPGLDYTSNCLPHDTYPRGLDVEAFTFAALERAWREDGRPDSREHVTPYIERHPNLFRQTGVTNPVDYSALRWTVDTSADLELVRRIFMALGDGPFGWETVLELLARHPEWSDLNRHVPQKMVNVYVS